MTTTQSAAAWRRSTWNTHLERHAAQVPDRPALVFAGETVTWSQLRDRVAVLAGALVRRGVGPRRPGRGAHDQPHGVPRGGARRHADRRDGRPGQLPAHRARGGVRPRRRRPAGARVRGRPRRDRRGRPAGPGRGAGRRRAARAGAASRRRALRRPARRGRRGRAAARRRRGQPGAGDVHLRHHGAPQGGGAHPRQPAGPGADGRARVPHGRRRAGRPVRLAAVPHRRARDVRTHDPGGRLHRGHAERGVRPGPAARRARAPPGHDGVPRPERLAGRVRRPDPALARPVEPADDELGGGPRLHDAAAADGARPSPASTTSRCSGRRRCRR